jgi:hypothetical protein
MDDEGKFEAIMWSRRVAAPARHHSSTPYGRGGVVHRTLVFTVVPGVAGWGDGSCPAGYPWSYTPPGRCHL